MDVFHDYANFYDILYEDKDYLKECNFIKKVFEKYSDLPVNSLLDLGCGTGSHALHFVDMGYNVIGIDFSKEMLDIACKKNREAEINIKFVHQDIRHLNLEEKFDAAVAMFAVMGYQTTNSDFEAALKSVYQHLNDGGLFVFDVWFGPAVLTEKPEERVKIIDKGDIRIIRHARPILDVIQQTVDVKYHILEIKENIILNETKESHLMRFFFYQELKYFLNKNGFLLLNISSFLNLSMKVSEKCWNISVICKKSS